MAPSPLPQPSRIFLYEPSAMSLVRVFWITSARALSDLATADSLRGRVVVVAELLQLACWSGDRA